MDGQLKRMLVQSQAAMAANLIRAAGAVARQIGDTVGRSLEEFSGALLAVVNNWACQEQMLKAQRHQVEVIESSSVLREVFVQTLGEDAWAKYQAMRAERGPGAFVFDDWTKLFGDLFAKEKVKADAAKAEAAKPEAPTAS